MMEQDKELEFVTEAYLTQRLYAPRVVFSDKFNTALLIEISRLIDDGVNPKRVTAAVQFLTQKYISEARGNATQNKKAIDVTSSMTLEEGVDALVGKRVFLNNPNPGGYPNYAGTVRGRWEPFKGSSVYDNWADIDWDTTVHPCTNPMEIKHLRLANPP